MKHYLREWSTDLTFRTFCGLTGRFGDGTLIEISLKPNDVTCADCLDIMAGSKRAGVWGD